MPENFSEASWEYLISLVQKANAFEPRTIAAARELTRRRGYSTEREKIILTERKAVSSGS